MGQHDFRRLASPLVRHHLHDNDNVVDGDVVKGIQDGLLVEPEVQAELVEHEPADSLGFRWRVPLSWVNNPFGVLTLYRDQLDA